MVNSFLDDVSQGVSVSIKSWVINGENPTTAASSQQNLCPN